MPWDEILHNAHLHLYIYDLARALFPINLDLFPLMKVHTNKPQLFKEGSVQVAPAEGAGQGPIHRCGITKEALVFQPFEGIDTVHDVLAYAARTHGTRNAMGWREIISIHEEEKEVKKVVDGKEITEKKKWKYFELSDYQYLNYIEVKDYVNSLARALVDIGISSDDVFNVYAQTRYLSFFPFHLTAALNQSTS